MRHGIMVVGPTGGGKSSNIRMLGTALTKLKQKEVEGDKFEVVKIHHLNPKSVRMGELYGEFDSNTVCHQSIVARTSHVTIIALSANMYSNGYTTTYIIPHSHMLTSRFPPTSYLVLLPSSSLLIFNFFFILLPPSLLPSFSYHSMNGRTASCAL